MSVQVQKAKGGKQDLLKPTDKTALSAEEKAKVDELVALKAQIDAFKATTTKFSEVKDFLQSIADERFDATTPAVLKGNKGVVEFGKKTDSREISDMQGLIGKLKEKLGYEGLLALLRITLADVDKYLTDDEKAGFITKTIAGGSRSLKSAISLE